MVQKVCLRRGSGSKLKTVVYFETIENSLTHLRPQSHESCRTYSNASSRPPWPASSQIFVKPPCRTAPRAMTATNPASMITICMTSVQITAFRPPCGKHYMWRSSGANLKFSQKSWEHKLTIEKCDWYDNVCSRKLSCPSKGQEENIYVFVCIQCVSIVCLTFFSGLKHAVLDWWQHRLSDEFVFLLF